MNKFLVLCKREALLVERDMKDDIYRKGLIRMHFFFPRWLCGDSKPDIDAWNFNEQKHEWSIHKQERFEKHIFSLFKEKVLMNEDAPQTKISGDLRIRIRALIEDGERKEIKRDAERYREIIKKTEEMLKGFK